MISFRQSPSWFRMLNRLWEMSYFSGTRIRLDKDLLIAAARRKTGLSDLGHDFNDEPIERLLDSIESEANLSPVGRFITRERFVNLLSIRLRAEYYFKKYPGILNQALYPAWVIVGLQRTGTTKLQRLLSEDPDHRVIPSWEVINPVPIDLKLYDSVLKGLHSNLSEGIPPVSENPLNSSLQPQPHNSRYPHPADKRISIANTSVTALKYMSPGFFAVHPIEALLPEEDILLLDVSFMSTTPEAMMHVPSYASWLEQTDQSEAYAYAVKILKFLQWIKPAKRWILKSPHHLEFPHLIEKHFGEVHFLWPHRRIYESVPSFLSMVTYNRMIFSNRVDEKEVADHWVRKIGYMLEKALNYRSEPGKDQKFTDIFYKDFISDSTNAMRRIYSLNGGLTPELSDRFRRHEEEHPHRKHGIHQYSLEDFNLSAVDIDNYTMQYQKFTEELYGRNQAKPI